MWKMVFCTHATHVEQMVIVHAIFIVQILFCSQIFHIKLAKRYISLISQNKGKRAYGFDVVVFLLPIYYK